MLIQDRRAVHLLNPLIGCPSSAERSVLVLAFLIVIAARMPEVALHGRVWAEEGAAFMRNAIVLPWYRAIVAPVGGYLNLVANFAGLVAARVVPLEQARWVGVVTGLLFQAFPAVLIVSSGFDWLQTRAGLVVALLLIATVPLAEEVWLNSLHPQFHLTLCVALILAMDPARGWTSRFHLMLILLATLCGPTTWFLLPLFVLRAVTDRSPQRAAQAVVLAAGLLLQVIVFYDASQVAREPFSLSALVSAFFVKNLLIPTLDFRTASAIGASLRIMAMAGMVPVAIAVAEVVFVCLGGAFLWARGMRTLFWMFAAAVLIAALSYTAARNGSIDLMIIGVSNRYAFVPQVLFALVLLGVANTAGSGTIRRLAQGGVLWLLTIGIVEFHNDSIRHSFTQGPRWVDEVAAWRQDPSHILRLWPDQWTLDLNSRPLDRSIINQPVE